MTIVSTATSRSTTRHSTGRMLVALVLVAATAVTGLAGATAADAARRPSIERLRLDVGSAEQVVLVRGFSWRSSRAVLELFERDGNGWRRVLGPITARVGRRGFSLTHREGDGTSPAGVFSLTEAFGVRPDPGAQLPYRVAGPDDWWVSDPASPLYNTWQTGPVAGRWNPAAGEHLRTHGPTAYAHAVVIDYNRSPVVAGAGSAMFVHVGGVRATSGCVSVGLTSMIRLVRWLDPSRHPVIVMGPESWLLDRS